MDLKVHCTQILTLDQIQLIYNAIQTCGPNMAMDQIVDRLIHAAGNGELPKTEEGREGLKNQAMAIWHILGLPSIKTVRDAYKFYILSLERQMR